MLGLTVANFASAALVTCGGYTEAGEKQTACTVKDILFTIERIINFLLAWAWLVSIAFILWGAYNMVTSAGNEEAIADGKLKNRRDKRRYQDDAQAKRAGFHP